MTAALSLRHTIASLWAAAIYAFQFVLNHPAGPFTSQPTSPPFTDLFLHAITNAMPPAGPENLTGS